MPHRRILWMSAIPLLLALAAAQAQQPADGLRVVNVKRFGIVVHAPVAWSLITWAQDDQAFVLKLPQETGSPPGYVSCELAVAPENLEEYQKRHQAAAERETAEGNVRRKLMQNEIEPLSEKRYGKEQAAKLGKRLVSLWEYTGEKGEKSYRLCSRVISEDTLYTMTLATDEAHFDAYRSDFEDMLATSEFSPPETGLQRMPGGFWMQREYRFALRLPPEWKPAFGPNDKALFFATGETREVFTDNLLVLAELARPLDFEGMQKELPEAIAKLDPAATVPVCDIVAQNGAKALEVMIQTRRGPLEITILERRFQGLKRNYEVKFTCETKEFKKLEPELRKAMDSFREVADQKPANLL